MANESTPTRTRTKRPTPEQIKKRRLVAIVVGSVVLVGAVVGVILGINYANAPTSTPAAPTVTAPVPTPTVSAITVPTDTALAAAIPSTVGTYALVEATPIDTSHTSQDPVRVAGGYEGYRLVYSDGVNTINLELVQFGSADAATAYAHQASATKPATAVTSPVTVGGQQVGTVVNWDENIVWTNSTLAMHATGPTAELVAFQKVYPL